MVFMAEVYDQYMKKRLSDVAICRETQKQTKLNSYGVQLDTVHVLNVHEHEYQVKMKELDYKVDLSVGTCTCSPCQTKGTACAHLAVCGEFAVCPPSSIFKECAGKRQWIEMVVLGRISDANDEAASNGDELSSGSLDTHDSGTQLEASPGPIFAHQIVSLSAGVHHSIKRSVEIHEDPINQKFRKIDSSSGSQVLMVVDQNIAGGSIFTTETDSSCSFQSFTKLNVHSPVQADSISSLSCTRQSMSTSVSLPTSSWSACQSSVPTIPNATKEFRKICVKSANQGLTTPHNSSEQPSLVIPGTCIPQHCLVTPGIGIASLIIPSTSAPVTQPSLVTPVTSMPQQSLVTFGTPVLHQSLVTPGTVIVPSSVFTPGIGIAQQSVVAPAPGTAQQRVVTSASSIGLQSLSSPGTSNIQQSSSNDFQCKTASNSNEGLKTFLLSRPDPITGLVTLAILQPTSKSGNSAACSSNSKYGNLTSSLQNSGPVAQTTSLANSKSTSQVLSVSTSALTAGTDSLPVFFNQALPCEPVLQVTTVMTPKPSADVPSGSSSEVVAHLPSSKSLQTVTQSTPPVLCSSGSLTQVIPTVRPVPVTTVPKENSVVLAPTLSVSTSGSVRMAVPVSNPRFSTSSSGSSLGSETRTEKAMRSLVRKKCDQENEISETVFSIKKKTTDSGGDVTASAGIREAYDRVKSSLWQAVQEFGDESTVFALLQFASLVERVNNSTELANVLHSEDIKKENSDDLPIKDETMGEEFVSEEILGIGVCQKEELDDTA